MAHGTSLQNITSLEMDMDMEMDRWAWHFYSASFTMGLESSH